MLTHPQLRKEQQSDSGGGTIYDIVVIGAGPAGMSAALCAARADLKVMIIDKALPGGEAATAYKIDNFLGYPGGILGEDLTKRMEDHLDDFDIPFTCGEVDDIRSVSPHEKIVTTSLEDQIRTKTIILCVGLEPKPIGRPFERQFLGRGISYFARGDANAYRGKDIAVIGGGNCACYAADYLSGFADNVYLVHRSDTIKAVKRLKDQVLSNPKIKPIWHSEVVDAFGVDKLEKIKLQHTITGQHTWIDVKGMFVYVGRIPPKAILHLGLSLDEKGHIVTDEYMRTNIPGVFAAGDVRSKQIRQIATAVSDGMIASINAAREIAAGGGSK